MNLVPLTDVQRINLAMLMLIKEHVMQDPGAACCQFDLDVAQLQTFANLSVERILVAVERMGHESLFLPRSDLDVLFELPLELSGAFASAKPSPRRAFRPKSPVLLADA